MLILTESLQHLFVWPSENQRSGASGRPKKSRVVPGIFTRQNPGHSQVLPVPRPEGGVKRKPLRVYLFKICHVFGCFLLHVFAASICGDVVRTVLDSDRFLVRS